MNNDKKILEEYGERYEINIDTLLELYKEGDSLSAMVRKLDSTKHRVSEILRLLRLRVTHSDGTYVNREDRVKYIADLEYRLNNNDVAEYREEIQKQADQIETLLGEHKKMSKSLVRARDISNILRAQVRKESREEWVVEAMVNAIASIKIDLPDFPKLEKIDKIDWGDIICFSDTHGNNTQVKEEVGHDYSIEIWKDRRRQVIEQFINKGQRSNNVILAELGDSWEQGLFLDEVKQEMEQGVSEMFKTYVEDTYEQIISLLAYYDKVEYIALPSNHLRMQKDRNTRQHWDTFDIISAMGLEMLIKHSNLEDRVSIKWDKRGYYLRNVNGEEFLFHHGHNKSLNSKANIADMQALIKDLFGKEYRYSCGGHTHLEGMYSANGTINYVSGSLIGQNGYTVANVFGSSEIMQYGFHINEDGILEYVYRLVPKIRS